MMIRSAIVLLLFMAGLLMPTLFSKSDATVETSHLIVSDATGNLSIEQLKQRADNAQETLNKIIAFWSADPEIARLGKIRVIFDVPRRDVYSSVFYWGKNGDEKTRIVRVFGIDEAPQMMAHKLTSAIFPQKDKLIRNMMGVNSR